MTAHEKHALERLKLAARAYVDACEHPPPQQTDTLARGAELRLAAKDFVRAEREVRSSG